MRRRTVSAGFTLIELMVVLVVAAVLQSLAAPAVSAMLDSVRVTSAVNSLFSSFLLARSEAIKRNAHAVVCKSDSGETCATGGGWEQGWIVFHDVNKNARRDPGEARLSRQSALSASIRLTGNGPVASYVSYTPMGNTTYTAGAFQAGTLIVCAKSANRVEAHQLALNMVGRPRTVKAKLQRCP